MSKSGISIQNHIRGVTKLAEELGCSKPHLSEALKLRRPVSAELKAKLKAKGFKVLDKAEFEKKNPIPTAF